MGELVHLPTAQAVDTSGQEPVTVRLHQRADMYIGDQYVGSADLTDQPTVELSDIDPAAQANLLADAERQQKTRIGEERNIKLISFGSIITLGVFGEIALIEMLNDNRPWWQKLLATTGTVAIGAIQIGGVALCKDAIQGKAPEQKPHKRRLERIREMRREIATSSE